MLHTPARRPSSQGARITGRRLPDYNIMGVFPDLGAARAAIDALSHARLEADNVSLTGAAADRAAADTNTRIRDASITKYVSRGVLRGALIGAAVGAGGGLIVAVGLAVLDVEVTRAGVLVALLLGLIGGSMLGGFLGGMSVLDPAEPWELTFEEQEGHAIVGVHSEQPQDADRAEQILQDQHPIDLYRLSSGGRRI